MLGIRFLYGLSFSFICNKYSESRGFFYFVSLEFGYIELNNFIKFEIIWFRGFRVWRVLELRGGFVKIYSV